VRARLAQSLDDSGNLERVPFVARNTSPKAESALPRLNQWLNRTLRSIVPKTPIIAKSRSCLVEAVIGSLTSVLVISPQYENHY
jgi:hypothetical protein